jgi:polyhydroxyalkanoate synthesis regulator phasin
LAAVALACATFAPAALAQAPAVSDEQSLLELRNTVVNILEALVQRGVLTQAEAQAMVAQAQEQAETEIAELRAQETVEEGAVRVTYVPEIVKDEIAASVSEKLEPAVVDDVVERARTEGWGVPGALPSWVRNIDIDTRLRVRGEGIYYEQQNVDNVYLDFNAINDAGGIGAAGLDALLNTTQDRSRLRGRLRVDLKAEVAPTVTARLSFATGNANDPVSMNQTFANYGRRLNFAVQNAAIEWAPRNDRETLGFDLHAGRFDNPFLSSSILWDEDLSFEGIAGKVAFDVFRRGDPGLAPGVSLLLGAFPLEEVELASDDKWLYAGQIGLEVPMGERSAFRFASAYYQFRNVVGRRNAIDSRLNDYTAPALLARGNTLFDIRNDLDPDTNLFALASEFEIANLTAQLDFGVFGENRLRFKADYLENRGFDAVAVEQLVGEPVEARTTGRQVEIDIGRALVAKAKDWRVFAAYRYLERDAVLDAFTDSDFGVGGTDTEGYILGFDVGVGRNVWITTKWLSSNEIDGPPLSIDVLQLDLNTRF